MIHRECITNITLQSNLLELILLPQSYGNSTSRIDNPHSIRAGVDTYYRNMNAIVHSNYVTRYIKNLKVMMTFRFYRDVRVAKHTHNVVIDHANKLNRRRVIHFDCTKEFSLI